MSEFTSSRIKNEIPTAKIIFQLRQWTVHFVIIMALIGICFAEDSDSGKKLWAKSIINHKAPELLVEKWITAPPKTDGKFVVIDFWATWCGACRGAIPLLNEIQKKYKDKLVVIGISNETEDAVNKLDGTAIEYSSAIDTQGRMRKELEVRGIPHVLILDPEGIVRWEGFPALSGYELTVEKVGEIIQRYGK